MPNAILMHMDDHFGSGQLVFKNNNVEYGDDGIKGLIDYVPMAQGDWDSFDASPHHEYDKRYDSGTSRVMAHIEAVMAGTSQTSYIRKRVLLPRNFGSIPTDGLRVITYRNGAITSLKAKLLFFGSADAAVNGVSIKPVSDVTFEQFLMSPSGLYAPGDFLTIEVELVADTAGQYARIADLELIYRTARGNI